MKQKRRGFFAEKIKDGIFSLSHSRWGSGKNGSATINAVLVVGEEKAMLVDTGMRRRGFSHFVRTLTSLPLLVVNSHGHPDHTGNNGQFGEVYVNSADIPLLSRGFFGKIKVDYSVKDLQDGDVFALGGRTLTAYSLPGHSRGSMVFLDDKTKILLSGDAIARRLFYSAMGDWTDMSVYFQALDRIGKLDFSDVLSDHDRFLLPKDILRQIQTTICQYLGTVTSTWRIFKTVYVKIVVGEPNRPGYFNISVDRSRRAEVIADLKQNGIFRS